MSPPHKISPIPKISLEEALAKLRLADELRVEDTLCWDLGQGLGINLLQPATFDAPARLAATATSSALALPASCFRPTASQPPRPPSSTTATVTAPAEAAISRVGATTSAGQPVALCDFLARRLHAAIASCPNASAHGIRSDYNRDTVGQFVLETNRAAVSTATGTVSVVFEIFPTGGGGRRRLWRRREQRQEDSDQGTGGAEVGEEMAEILRRVIMQALLGSAHPGGGLDPAEARAHVESIEDQRHLRRLVAASDGIAFVADGSVLPRRGGSDDRPMEASRGAVPFQSPESLRREFQLPNQGVVRGMLVPRGVTIIVGGGYHGKSTLLRALAVGVYDKIPGDGRELAVTDPGAVIVRAEDGRPVSGVDISPFISSLPSSAASASREGTGISTPTTNSSTVASNPGREAERDGSEHSNDEGITKRFSTGGASGSTSQAANVMEALEAGATALLLDEDTCAGNFMIRDSRMRAMVHHEPITPFIYRVSSLWLELGVSSVIVVGGCGDYFDVHDTAILVDNYIVSNVTERAHSISRRFCVGRVQYAGRGLVHRLPWPGNPLPRAVVPESVLGSASRVVATPTTKRKRDSDHDNSICGVETASEKNSAGGGRHVTGSNGDGSNQEAMVAKGIDCQDSGKQTAGRNAGGDDCNGDAAQTDEEYTSRESSGKCPCFCGRGHRGGNNIPIGEASVDLSRVEQLVSGGAMARGCALGVQLVARATERSPGFLSVSGALDFLDGATVPDLVGEEGGCGNDGRGLETLFVRDEQEEQQLAAAAEVDATTASVLGGPLVALPRRFEVAAALHRLPGVQFRSVTSVSAVDAE